MGNVLGRLLQAKYYVDRFTQMAAFRQKARHPMAVQWAYLEELLATHHDTEFGRQYDFKTIHSVKDYQKRVPLHSWEDISPYMEKLKAGHFSALIPPQDPVFMFATSSGTTGAPKFIPVTRRSYRDYGRYWNHSWSNFLRYYPEVFRGKLAYFPGDPEEGYLGNIPYGAITAKAYAQQNILFRNSYLYPFQIARIKDYALRYYTIMRICLEQDVSLMPIANPSTVLTLVRTAREHAEELIEDIETGRLRHQDQIPPVLSADLQKKIRPNPARARELRSIRETTGDLLPKDYWRHRQHFMCFASGPMKLYLQQFGRYFGEYAVADTGLLASEGRLSFALGSIDHFSGTCLALESSFFEFIPEEQVDRPQPDILTLQEVEAGRNYYIVFSNHSGLYRYHIVDLVRIEGFFENVPTFSFLNKGRHFSSITGEKLSEYQVTETVHRASEKMGYRLEDFVVCLHWDEERPSYTLIKAKSLMDDPRVLSELVNLIENEIMSMNPEYRSKRQSLRLGPLTLKTVAAQGFEKYEKERQQRAHNLSQYKHIFLVNDPDFEKQFTFSDILPSRTLPS